MKNLCKQILEKHNFKVNSIKKLNAGAASVIYIADTNKGKLVVKVRIHEGGNLEKEYTVLKAIEKEKIAPKVYAQGVIDEQQYLIEDYVVGRRLPRHNMKNIDVKLVARFFKKIHSIRRTKELKKLSIGKSKPEEKLIYAKSFQHLSKPFAELIKKVEPIISHANVKVRLALRHADPNPYNLIMNKNRLIVIDWEESKIGHPAIDIADFIVKANLTMKQEEIFYKNYILNDALKKEVKIYIITAVLGLAAWHLERIDNIKKSKLDKRLYTNIEEEIRLKDRFIKDAEKIINNY